MSNELQSSHPQREKYWSELDGAQRVERLRAVVRRLMSQLDDARATISKLKRASECHEHSATTGLPVMPVKPANELQNEASAPRRVEKPDECFI